MSFRRILTLTIAFALIVAASYLGRAITSEDPLPPAAAEPVTDIAELDRLITVFSERAPVRQESLEYRRLGDLYTAKAEATGELSEYRRAIESYSAAVAIDPEGMQTQLLLATSLLTLHEFEAADQIVQDLVADASDDIEVLSVAGDVALERGDLDRAAGHYRALAELASGNPAVSARLANLAYLTGDGDEARRLASLALDQAAGYPATEIAFFQSFAGSVAFLTGDLEAADRHHGIAAALTPWDQGAVGELARIRAARGDYASAIALLEEANRIQPEPDHLTRLADLYVIAGRANSEAIEALYSEGTALATQDADYARAWARLHAQFLLDHERQVEEALTIAERELEQRRDPGAWDLYAWALFHNGRLDEARVASDRAQAQGTVNAAYLYHSGVIAAAMDDTERAIADLKAALDLNPGFEPVHGAKAEALLAEVKG